ncbi:MAG: radical SAM protein, partial [Candidatus Sumerlaeota bacterium]|nr:radical SAM protein [Candidatus Sumerlaeota bacterium]
YPNLGTIDAGRGCPFSCSFCTIINVQGKKMRCRSAEGIIAHVRTHFPEIRYYFFTDDNFARNPNWEAILDGLIQLREDEGLDVTFMMQVDAPSYRIRSFCEKARRAGCSQVFIGLEALREESLAAAGKKQNKAINYQAMVEAWHQSDIAIHVGYIIGFPDDTPALVAEDVRRLKEELGIDQVSFFILTPLPGSQDYADLIKAGAIVDPDYNKFDSFQPVTDHPKMTREEWLQAYLDAWDSFYTLDHMRDRLLASSEPIYWGLFKNYIWYRASVLERTHPMIAGFFRLKDRALRRPGFAVQGRWKHLRMRTRDVARTLRQWTRLYFDTQELWLETRPRRGRFAISMEELKARLAAVREGASLKGRRLQEAAGERVAAMREGATAQAHRLQEAASDRLTAMREGASVQAHRLQEAASERLTAMRTSAQEGLTRVQQNVQEGIKHGRQNLSAFGQEIVDTGRRTPGRIVRMWDKLRFWSAKGIYTRAALNQYWKTTYANLRKGRIFDINPAMLLWNALRDAKLTTSFAFHLILARTK